MVMTDCAPGADEGRDHTMARDSRQFWAWVVSCCR